MKNKTEGRKGSNMKCVVCERVNEFKLKEVQKPIPKENEALIRIKRVGICGTDLHAYNGKQPYFSYPRVLGHELSGVIEEINNNKCDLKKGDRVAIIPYLECGECIACLYGKTNCCTNMNVLGVHSDGGMQEYLCVPYTHLIKNDNLSFEKLALTECFAIGAHSVRRANVLKDETVLVIGAGPIGLGIMQFAQIVGAKVIAMDIDKNRLNFAKNELNVYATVLAAKDDTEENIKKLTSNNYPTVIFDATGNPKSMMQGFTYLAHGGRYVLVSIVDADITFYDPEFHKRETTLMSSRNATKEDFEWVIKCMEEDKVILDPIITHRSNLNDMISSFPTWLDPKSGVIKAVVEV